MAESKPSHSFVDLIDICDNFRLAKCTEKLVPFVLPDPHGRSKPSLVTVGLLRPETVSALIHDGSLLQTQNLPPSGVVRAERSESYPDGYFTLHTSLDSPGKRSAAMKAVLERWRDTDVFSDIIGGRMWRDELYPVYYNPFGSRAVDGDNFAFDMERAACALFGIVTYGIHMTVYRTDPQAGKLIWVPKRSKTKQTWPGYLDNSVAGGIPSGMSVFESAIKESMEEASISEDIVRQNARPVGSVSYYHETPKGWLQPEVEFVYDLCIPDNLTSFQPLPSDGEVEAFALLSVDEVLVEMRKGLFKPNCAVVIIDFLVRHGYITPDSEPQYQEMITRLHGRFEWERWADPSKKIVTAA